MDGFPPFLFLKNRFVPFLVLMIGETVGLLSYINDCEGRDCANTFHSSWCFDPVLPLKQCLLLG